MKEQLNKQKDNPSSWIRRLNIIKSGNIPQNPTDV